MSNFPGRLMKKDVEGLTDLEKLTLFFRLYPCQAAKELLFLDLMWFQRIQLREFWTKPYCVMKAGRGTSKTFSAAAYLVLKALLYPGMKIGIIAPGYRQSGFVFDEIEKLFQRSPYFRQAVVGKKIKRTTDRLLVEFLNGSSIEGLPIGTDGSKIRGRRYMIVLCDEMAVHNEQTIELVVVPFLSVKYNNRANQIIMCSSPQYKTNHFYKTFMDYKKDSKDPEKGKLYSCTSYNFIDVLISKHKEISMDLNLIYENFRKQHFDDFMMEFGGYFPSEQSSFFSSNLIDKCTPRIPEPIEPEFNGKPDALYVMGIDTAREEGEKNDRTAITIMKLDKNHKTNQIKSVVRVLSYKGKDALELSNIVREQIHIRNFNIVKIFIDYGGGGRALADVLSYHWTYKGIRYKPIVQDSNDYSPDYYNILKLVHFNVPTIDYMYNLMKADMDHEKVLFPLTVRRDLDSNIQEQGNEIKMLKSEMRHLNPVVSTKGLTFEADPKIGKDRITSAVLCNYAANSVYIDQLGDFSYEIAPPDPIWV